MNMLTCITIFNLFSLSLVYSFGAEWTDTTFATYPFVANIRLHGTLYCGGSIVSLNPGIILTAGYCVVGGNGEQIDPLSDDYEVWIGCTQSSCVQPNGEPTLYRVSRMFALFCVFVQTTTKIQTKRLSLVQDMKSTKVT